jgi:hypothetical protein
LTIKFQICIYAPPEAENVPDWHGMHVVRPAPSYYKPFHDVFGHWEKEHNSMHRISHDTPAEPEKVPDWHCLQPKVLAKLPAKH